MLPLTKKFWNLLRAPQQKTVRRRQPVVKKRTQLWLETLEDRVTPSTAGFGSAVPAVLTGFVYVDANGNGLFDPGETGVPGVSVTLTDTTGQHAPVTTTTGSNGQYIFYQVAPGTYDITRGGVSNFSDGAASVGNLGGMIGADSVNDISVGQGQVAINDNFAVGGLSTNMVSARMSLNTSTPAQSDAFLPSPGSGFTAADNSVQPDSAASPGNSSLSGNVQTPNNAGVQNAILALSGIDFSGRAILLTTTTDANGNYTFGNLQPGEYNLNLIDIPNGLRDGQTTVGTVGGDIFQNGQVLNIQVAASTQTTGYNFTEIPLSSPASTVGLNITAGLADDTVGPGGTASDGITSDASIMGTVASSSPIVSFRAGFDNTPSANFANILASLNPGGSFLLNPILLALIFGGALPGGEHTLHLEATNSAGQTDNVDVQFTLDSSAPTTPTLHMDNVSDPNGTGATTASVVSLEGTTSPSVQVQLIQSGNVMGTTTSNASGNFTFSNITLQSGANDYTVQAVDIAGNTSQLQTYFLKDAGPVAVPTSAVSESLTQGATSDTFVDLNSPTMFTDAGFSDTLITFNTSAGPINAELFDTVMPQTVANFLDYVEQGAYNNDIFHRLAEDFVLQAGGFTLDPANNTITSVVTGPTIPDEFSTGSPPNVVGTIAMAMTSSPNSATSQFFFNLVDNTQTLGSSNDGGFAVFGKILSGADQRTLNTLIAATVTDESAYNSAFNTLPLENYTGTNFPTDTTPSNFDLINSVSIVQQTEQLTYKILSNTDTTGAIVSATITDGQLDLKPVAAGNATIVVQATDKAGETADISFTVNVAGAVTVTAPSPAPTNLEGDSVNEQISATDTSGGTLTYSATGLPPGLSINASTGDITGTVTAGDAANSPYSTKVTATDGTYTGSASFQWTVNPVVVVTNPGPVSDAIGTKVSLQIQASDADSHTLTYSSTSTFPTGLGISSTGLISGTIGSTSNTPVTYPITVTATDSSGFTASTTFQFTVTAGSVVDVVAPSPAPQNVEGDSVSLQITGTDADNLPLTYTDSATLPPGLSISSTGLITGNISVGDAANSPYHVTITGTDSSSNTGSTTFTWTVTNPITFTANPGTQSSADGDTISLADAAVDSKSGTVTYTDNGTLPPGLSIGTNGTITGTISSTADTNSPYSVTIKATDGTYTATQTFTWNVAVDPITFKNNPGSTAISDNQVVSIDDSVTDTSGGTPTYSALNLPPTLSIDPNSGLISGTVTATADSGNPYNVIVTAVDGVHSAKQTFTWNVNT